MGTADTTTTTHAPKNDLKQPDQLQKKLNQGFEFSQNHFIGVAAIAGLVLASWGGYLWYKKSQAQKQEAAMAKLYPIEKSYITKKANFDLASNPMAAFQDPEGVKAATKATGDLSADYGTIPTELSQFMTENKNLEASKVAALYLSDLYFSYKQPEKGIETLKAVSGGDKTLMDGLTKYRLAAELSATDCTAAIPLFKAVESNAKMSFLKNQASLNRALCLEETNKTEAQKIYTDLAKLKIATGDEKTLANADPMVASAAEKRLRYLKLSQ